MRILLYGLNYAPELTGIGKYSGELGAWLATRGHEVRVVTAPPYYPAWRVDSAYQSISYRVEHAFHGTTVFRVPLWVPRRPTGLKRMLHLLSFAAASAPVLLLQSFWQPHVVINIEPTFFSAPLGWLLARVCGARAWLHVQDFEVDAAFELGLIPAGGRLQGLAESLEGAFMRRFDRVSSISRAMVQRLQTKGVPEEKRVLFPNWVTIEGEAVQDDLRGDLKLEGKIVILYSGNMGAKQGLEMLAPLARSFSCDDRIQFVFCGDGAYRAQLEREVAELSNVTLLPLQPANRLGALLRTADVHLLPQRAGAADLVMPSKLAGMLASGRAVLATAGNDTEMGRMLVGRGVVVLPGDIDALRTGLLQLVQDRELRQRMGDAARLYAVETLGKEQVLERFQAELVALVCREP